MTDNDPTRSRAGAAAAAILILLTLPACAQTPDSRQVARETPRPSAPLIQGEHGIKSQAQSRAEVSRLHRRGDVTPGILEQIKEVAAITGAPLVGGNRVTLFNDGQTVYDAMIATIESAREYVHLETFLFEEGPVGSRFSEALTRKAAEGVQVLLIYDSYGSTDTSPDVFDRLRGAGVGVLEFNPLNPFDMPAKWNINHRDHRKILVVDDRIAFTGGFNISDAYTPGTEQKPSYKGTQLPWGDIHVSIEGPAAWEFEKLFVDTWSRQNGPQFTRREPGGPAPAAGETYVTALGSSPGELNRTTYMALVSAIDHARSYAWLMTPYFVPNKEMMKALSGAVKRGAKVNIILPDRSDSGATLYAGRYYYGKMLRAGVTLYDHYGGMLHAKTALVDGVWSSVGSANLDYRSFALNDEVNAIIIGQEFADKLAEAFEKELAECKPVSLEGWKGRSFNERIRELLSHAIERIL